MVKSKMIKVYLIYTLLLSVLFLSFSLVQAQPEVTSKETVFVNDLGDAHFEVVTKFSLSDYMQMKQVYGANPYTLVRWLRAGKAKGEVRNISVAFDDAHNALTVSFDLLGWAVNMKDYWEIKIGKGAVLASQTGNTLVFSYVIKDALLQSITSTLTLPPEAGGVTYDPDTYTVRYTLPKGFITDESRMPIAISLGLGIAVCVVVLVFSLRRGGVRYTPTPSVLPPTPPPPPTSVPAPQVAERMMYCVECGAKIPSSYTHCPVCGAKQE